ncbi:MAG: YkgJ family cysteine cluster protein [Chitinophagaceae bacterium]|nr:YkgJ family cysteine cluster protein [Chitinophagaceae bacterium]
MEEINLRVFKKKYIKNKRQLRQFLTRTENNPPKDLDVLSLQIDKAVWKDTDCLSCANCCKTMSPTYNFQDIKRISAHFNMKISEFKTKWLYLDKKDKDWMNTSRPCQFLNTKTNMCSIYEIRPADCAGFPHLTKKTMKDYLHVHKQNIEYCPATYKWVEKLQERILSAKTPNKAITAKAEI